MEVMPLMSLRRAALAAFLLAVAAAPGGAQRVDGIAAVVNEEAILESDVEEQLYLLLARAQAQPDSQLVDTLRHQVLEQLIDDKLIVAEAQRQGLTVSDIEVNRAVEQQLAQKVQELGGEQAFREQLRRENTTEDRIREKYRKDIRLQMLGQRLLAKQFPPKTVPKAEAEAYFKANPTRFPKAPAEARLSVIQIPVLPDSATSAKGARRRWPRASASRAGRSSPRSQRKSRTIPTPRARAATSGSSRWARWSRRSSRRRSRSSPAGSATPCSRPTAGTSWK